MFHVMFNVQDKRSPVAEVSIGDNPFHTTKGPLPLEQCRVRSVEVCASTSVAAAASRTVEL
jgi:hypothetical protein